MPPNIALLLSFVFIIFCFFNERKRAEQQSSDFYWPFIWYAITATRPISYWLSIWGFNLHGSDVYSVETSFDGWIYTFLTLMGMIVIFRRQIDWAPIIKDNIWFAILIAFAVVSISWSGYPFVSIKRAIKLMGVNIMVLVILTVPRPLEAITAMLRRSAYIIIPLSIVTIRYFRNIGVSWDWAGTAVSWQGITTSKNVLGQVAMTSAICFIWERIRRWEKKEGIIIDYLFIIMSLYLLKGSDRSISMTSFSVFVFGIFIFLCLQLMKSQQEMIKQLFILLLFAIISTLLTLIWHTVNPFSPDSLISSAIVAMGRDMTLTGRTDIWRDVFDVASRSPIVGTGYGGFWIGRQANIPWTMSLTWTLAQAHNGYVDVYLQLGFVGLFILFAVFISVIPKIIFAFQLDFEYARFRMTFFLLILFVNITESTFMRADHNMWFLFLLTLLSVPFMNSQKECQILP